MALTLKNSYNYKSTPVPSFMLLSKSAQSTKKLLHIRLATIKFMINAITDFDKVLFSCLDGDFSRRASYGGKQSRQRSGKGL